MFRRIIIALLLCCAFCRNALAADAQLEQLVNNFLARFKDKPEVAISVINVQTGKEIFSWKGEHALVPASTLKLVTSYAALRILGAEYEFPTEVFVDRPVRSAKDIQGGTVGNLYLRGYGDPSVVHETLFDWAQTIRQLGVQRIDNLVLDDTLFINPRGPLGDNPYQAAPNALSLNYNSYGIRITPLGAQQKALVTLVPDFGATVASELLSVANPRVERSVVQAIDNAQLRSMRSAVSRLHLTVRGQVLADSPSIIEYRTIYSPTIYFGDVLQKYLAKNGVSVGGIKVAAVSGNPKTLVEFRSRSLDQIVFALNHYSNNFIAEQLLFILGQNDHGLFDRNEGLMRLTNVLQELGVSHEEFNLVDGSGLSEQNKISARALTRVLFAAYHDFTLAPVYLASLSQYGRSGTLKSRKLGAKLENKQDNIWGKTGTIDGVSALAGYLQTESNQRLAYSIIVNGVSFKQLAGEFEDSILKTLLTGY